MKNLVRFAHCGLVAACLVTSTGCTVRQRQDNTLSDVVKRGEPRFLPDRAQQDNTLSDVVMRGEPTTGVIVAARKPTSNGLEAADVPTPPPARSPDVLRVAYQQDGSDDDDDPMPLESGDDRPPSETLPEWEALNSVIPEDPASPGALTLDQIINATLLADPKLRAGFETINQASGDALSASLLPNPSLGAVQSLLPLTRPFTVDAQGGPPQLDFGLSYPIDWFLFGKRAAAMQATGLGVRATEAEFADLVRLRVLEAATAYFDVLQAKSLLNLARQDVENYRRVEEQTRKAVDAGGRPQVELNRIHLGRLRAELTVRQADNVLTATFAKLRAVMGQGAADPTFDVAGSLNEIRLIEILPAEEALAIAIENRPDISANQLRIAQADADTELQRRRAYPEVSPQVGYTRQFQQKALGFPDVNSFGFGVQMTVPLFDRNQGNRYRAASIATQQRFTLQASLVQLRSEVVQAEKELRTAAENVNAVAGEHLTLAIKVRDSLYKAYEAGSRPLIDVLDANRNYRETYRLFIETRANYGRAAARFEATMGRKITP